MTPFKLFVSVFFISLGIFFLLDLNPYYYHPFSLNLKLLPLLLVFIGILLLKPKKIITMITVSLMAILLSSCIFSTNKYWSHEGWKFRYIFQKYEKVEDDF
jgi:hypothetical protein